MQTQNVQQTVKINAALLANMPVDSEVVLEALPQVPSISAMLREAQEREYHLNA